MSNQEQLFAKFNQDFFTLCSWKIQEQRVGFTDTVTRLLTHARELKSISIQVMVYNTTANKYIEGGETDLAIKVFQKTADFIRESKSQVQLTEKLNVQLMYIQLHMALGSAILSKKTPDYMEAKSSYKIAEETCIKVIEHSLTNQIQMPFPKTETTLTRLEIIKMIGWCDERLGNDSSALRAYSVALKICEPLSALQRKKSPLATIGIAMSNIYRKRLQKEAYLEHTAKMKELLENEWR
jgi:tetratricopeptide (TPR) repeat protein